MEEAVHILLVIDACKVAPQSAAAHIPCAAAAAVEVHYLASLSQTAVQSGCPSAASSRNYDPDCHRCASPCTSTQQERNSVAVCRHSCEETTQKGLEYTSVSLPAT